ncbi:hypothetical protein [Cellulomonas sp.]|uniref:hypothetical protein n=1 Tax=Cellulomonas sp. TaxID=40001 RepID=UPI002811AD57|nr:hypothetical protein [Cellulomonas sp.]
MLTLAKAVAAVTAVAIGAVLGVVTQVVDDALAGLDRQPVVVERSVEPTARTATTDG